MIVTKAVHMAQMMSIPVLGLIENYSYYQCPDCGAKHAIFGESHLEQEAMQLGLPPAGPAAYRSGAGRRHRRGQGGEPARQLSGGA